MIQGFACVGELLREPGLNLRGNLGQRPLSVDQ
jgi:hypothetical protein